MRTASWINVICPARASTSLNLQIFVIIEFAAMSSTTTPLFREVKHLKGHEDSINALSFSPDGNFLASGGDDGRLLIFDTKSWWVKKKYENSTGISAIVWHQDPNGVVSIGMKSGIVSTIQLKVRVPLDIWLALNKINSVSKQDDVHFEHSVGGTIHCMSFDSKRKNLGIGFNDQVQIVRQATICKHQKHWYLCGPHALQLRGLQSVISQDHPMSMGHKISPDQ